MSPKKNNSQQTAFRQFEQEFNYTCAEAFICAKKSSRKVFGFLYSSDYYSMKPSALIVSSALLKLWLLFVNRFLNNSKCRRVVAALAKYVCLSNLTVPGPEVKTSVDGVVAFDPDAH